MKKRSLLFLISMYLISIINTGCGGGSSTPAAGAGIPLSSLTDSGLMIDTIFDPASLTYSLRTLESSITLIPAVADGSATITVNGTTVASGSASSSIGLTAGSSNVITVQVSKSGCSDTTYNITYYRVDITSWSSKTAGNSHEWNSVGMSDDGSVMIACDYDYSTNNDSSIYISTDYGSTWTKNTAAGNALWRSVAVSGDGQVFYAGKNNGQYIYKSVNGGTSWTEITNCGNGSWLKIAASHDGTVVAAVNGFTSIDTSKDGGTTWKTYSLSNATDVDVSSDGSKMIATPSGAQIYYSSDYGDNWSALANSTSTAWSCCSISGDGTKLAAGIWSNSKIYYSTDSGTTWNASASTSGSSWASINASYDGKIVMACDQNSGGIFISQDYGANWLNVYTPATYGSRSGAVSADGTYFAAGLNVDADAMLICK